MKAYICKVCGYLYDEESAEKGIENKIIPFENLDTEWVCPACGANQELFEETDSNRPPDVPVK
ncbi:MAG: rubredoxin [bacterium]